MSPRSTPADREVLSDDLASLPNLETPVLKDRWRRLYGTEPGKGLGRRLLVRAIAYRLQEQALGALKPATRRWLERAAADPTTGTSPAVAARRILPGTRLLREWQGVTHEVLVVDNGFLFRGRHHRSLSEIARLITSTRWSGPLFFGLKARQNAN